MNLHLAARQSDLVLHRSPVLGKLSPVIDKLSNVAWRKAAFIACWEGQGHLSSLAYIGLVAFASIWVALVAMFVWSAVATIVFCAARERGYPNLLSDSSSPRFRGGANIASYAIGSLFRAWLTGINAFIYARCSGFLITKKQGCCRARRFARIGALVIGLTLFGVTAAEHLLRTAGYSGRKLAHMSLIGPFLNVPYRVLVSAAVLALMTDALGVVTI